MLKKNHPPVFPPPTVPSSRNSKPLFLPSSLPLWSLAGWQGLPTTEGGEALAVGAAAQAVGAGYSPKRWVNAGPGKWLGGVGWETKPGPFFP